MTVTVIIGCSWLPVTGCRAAAGAASLRSAGESTQATSIQVEVVELRPGHWRNSPSLAAVLLEPSRQVGKNPKPRTVLQCQPVTFSPWLGTWASARPEPTRGETRRAWPASEPRAWSRDGRRRGPWPTDIRIEWSADTCLFGLYRGRTGRLGGRSSTPEALYCSTLFARVLLLGLGLMLPVARRRAWGRVLSRNLKLAQWPDKVATEGDAGGLSIGWSDLARTHSLRPFHGTAVTEITIRVMLTLSWDRQFAYQILLWKLIVTSCASLLLKWSVHERKELPLLILTRNFLAS